MKPAHQQFSAQTRRNGELEPPQGQRRRNLETGRISVVLGNDIAIIVADDAETDGRSVGGFIRKLVVEHYLNSGWNPAALAARAAALRATNDGPPAEEPAPAPDPTAAF